MRTTIDKAGRTVIPKSIRDELNLYPGAELEVESKSGEVRLRVAGAKSTLIRKRGVLIHHSSGAALPDVAAFIRGEREARGRRGGAAGSA